MAAADTLAAMARARPAFFCQGRRANDRQMARIGSGHSTAPEKCAAPATPRIALWPAVPEAKAKACSRPPAFHTRPQSAKKMLARGVPGRRAARRVKPRGRAGMRNPPVKSVRLAAKKAELGECPC